MNYKNFNTKEFLHQTQSNVFIKQIKIFEIDLNLLCVFVMILCKLTYNQKLNDQISKRAYRFDQQRIVIYYVFRNNTIIEELIEQKRKNKSDFEKKNIHQDAEEERERYCQRAKCKFCVISKHKQLI